MSNRPEQLRNLVHQWFREVWNNRRSEVIHQMLSPQCLVNGVRVDGATVTGPDEFQGFYEVFRGAFPDVQIEVLDTIVEGDRICTRCRVTATHKGAHLGFPATELPVDFTGTVFARFEDDKIVEAWNNFDFLTMYHQVGLLKPKDTRIAEA